MTDKFEFAAEIRSSVGSNSVRALRRQDKVPAILYGGEAEPALLSLNHNEVIRQLENKSIYSHILDIKIKGKKGSQKAVLKSLQRHPYKSSILHMDFQRITKSQKIRVHVPIRFIGEETSVGVKKGGVVTHNLVDLEISCLPDDLPEYIEVDVSDLDIGQTINLSEIKLPKGVEIPGLVAGDEHDVPLVSIQHAYQESVSEEEEAAEDDDREEGVDTDQSAESE